MEMNIDNQSKLLLDRINTFRVVVGQDVVAGEGEALKPVLQVEDVPPRVNVIKPFFSS
jgi:hypothetical protein